MNLQEEISRIQSIMESMYVDEWGRLHYEEEKIIYPFKKISKFVDWFQQEYKDYAAKQGWAIFDSDTEVPNIKYKHEPDNKRWSYFQVQRLDNPAEDEALFGKLSDDMQADELAKKLGLVLDEFGVIIGWKDQLFI
jgi:hypothetical protein